VAVRQASYSREIYRRGIKVITLESLMSIDKNDLQEASKTIDKNDLPLIIDWLSEKDDKVRYQALLLLQNRSLYFDDVYPFWEIFVLKLKSSNSYQRSIGLMLIAENTKWDEDNRFDEIKDEYFAILNDEKPITVRQCIQSLSKIIPYKNHLHMEIANKLMSINITKIKETMRKLVLLDILGVLAMIRKYQENDDIENYIQHALTGGFLDKKSIKQVESML
jgi:hypothetical protein